MAENAARDGVVGSIQRYVAVIGGAILAGIVMSWTLGSMVSERGVPGPLVIEAISPVRAVATLAPALLVTTAIGVLVGRIVNPAVGTFVVGVGLGVTALGSGSYTDALFSNGLGIGLPIETLAWGGVSLLVALVLYRTTGPLPDQPERSPAEVLDPRAVFSSPSLKGAAAGLLAVAVVFLFASNDLRGQALGAAVLAGWATGHVGRVLAPRHQPVLLYAAPSVFMAAAQLVATSTGTDGLVEAWIQGTSPRFLVTSPIDLAAGALIGVSMGIGTSRGFVEQHADD